MNDFMVGGARQDIDRCQELAGCEFADVRIGKRFGMLMKQLSKGLGSRHWAAAAITQRTKAIAIVVSQSSSTVRVFQNGALVLRIEPMEQAVKWQEFNYEPPPNEAAWHRWLALAI